MHLKHVRLCRALLLATRIPILLLAGFLHASASGKAQVGINISERRATVEKILNLIAAQSGCTLLYQQRLIENLPLIDMEIKEASVEQALEICFRNLPVTYTIYDKTISIKAREEIPVPKLLIKVTNEKGEPLARATITIKGTKRTFQTDSAGEYIFKEIPIGAAFVISNVGFETQEVRTGKNTSITVRLITSVGKLDEVQVIAYGTVTRRLNTGDVTTVKSDVLESQPVSNPLAALEGRVTGVDIVQSTGVPGSAYTIQVRGQNSIASGNNPLFIVDGVPFTSSSLSSLTLSQTITHGDNPLNNINPLDIESIEILKDADATAIYGSRGANGVILITTKKGKAGGAKIDLNIYNGIGRVAHMIPLLNTKQYLVMRHEAFLNDSAQPQSYDYDINGSWDTTRNTDWQKYLIGGKASYSDVQLTVSGGSDKTQFFFGGNYHRETTVFPGSFSDQKASGHFNLTHASANQKFKITFSVNYTNNNNNLYNYDLTNYALSLAPDSPPVYDSAGNLNWANGSWTNPLRYTLRKYVANTNNLIANTVFSYDLLAGFKFRISLGYTTMQMDETQTNPLNSFNPAYNPTSASAYTYFSHNSLGTWIIEPQLNWHRKYKSAELDFLAGTTFERDVNKGNTLQGTGFSSGALLQDIAAASIISPISAVYSDYRYNAFFGRVNYRFKEKLIINLTGRRDGSSRFGPGKQFANFGAVGAGYIFSADSWVKENLGFLSFGKIRASYGITGNDQIGNYQFLSTWSPTTFTYQNNGGLQPNNLYNPDYGWETNKKLEAGIELGFLKDRLFFTGNLFRNRSSNQLVGYSLPPSTGFTSIQSNLPATIQNSGFESELTTVNIKSKEFSWSTSINFTLPENKLVAYPAIQNSAYANIYDVGKSIYLVKAFQFLDVNKQTGVYEFSDSGGNRTASPAYPADLKGLKKVAKNFYGGIQNSFKYKTWQLDIFFQFVSQTGYNYINYFTAPGFAANQPSFVLDRWQKPGDNSSIQKFTQSFGNAGYAYLIYSKYYGDNRIGNASFVRLKNIFISYGLPPAATAKLHLNQCRFYIKCQNVFTVTKYKGMDPETQSSSLPPLQVLTGGVQINL